ncbi:translation initiation factor IF-2 subunit alpha [Candidatus Woesearchaeota archaeon]|nr:translation initiation factor IF-2 subunit alpha [Candidatus Woesearchaeota archaeon]
MLYKKESMPEEQELVICTVSKIQYHSVFVNIQEYGLTGMIHISEIAPGRIRNIRDYVKEDKVIVCKVLRIHHDKKHIDLSLRRVNDSQRRAKINEMKHEQKAESIIEFVAKQNKMDTLEFYNKVAPQIFKHYNFLFECFEDAVERNLSLEKLGIDKKISEQLEHVIHQRIKLKEVLIKGTLMLKSWDGEGVEIIQSALQEAVKVEGTDVLYLGGGKYSLSVKAKDYKIAEPRLKEAVDAALNYVHKHGGEGEFIREGK